jgi:serine/threonine protein kinase
MSEAPLNHPTDEELRSLSLGQLTEAELASLSAHLGACPTCCRRIDALGSADPLLARLQRSVARRDEELVPPARRRSAVRALRQGQASPATQRLPDPDAAPLVLPPPQQVGDYDILAEVGRGGMGVVYKARHRSLHRLAALKMVLAGEFASSAQQLRFRLEAELAARVQHPNIVQLYEIGTHDSRPFLAMEWVEGGSLADRLDGKPWPPGEAAALVETLARAIHVAHGEGVVHRDLKPANILLSVASSQLSVVSKDGSASSLTTDNWQLTTAPKITDFGLAQPMEGAQTFTQSGFLVGTPGYMAPEQASGRRALVGPATDIYALGVVLYQLLTGQLPFRGDSALDVLHAVLSDDPVRPRHLQARLPRDLETICLKCLAKEPGRRYADAQELAEDLRRFQSREPIVARRVGWLERLALWVRRRPTQAASCGLAALVLVLAGLFGAAASLWQRAEGALEREQRAKEDVEQARGGAEGQGRPGPGSRPASRPVRPRRVAGQRGGTRGAAAPGVRARAARLGVALRLPTLPHRTGHAPRSLEPRNFRGLQPRRPPPAHCLLGWDGEAVGRLHRPGAAELEDLEGGRRADDRRGLQPRRPPGHRLL